MRLTTEDIKYRLDLLRKNQSDTTSFEVKSAKKAFPSESNICSTLCAFANMPLGGTLVLGIGDESTNFAVSGVKNPGEVARKITDMARLAIEPSPVVEAYPLEIDEKIIVVADVSGLPLAMKPATFKSVPYLRQADGDYRMSETDLHMITVAKLRSDEVVLYDERVVPSTGTADLDKQLVNAYLKACRSTKKRLANVSNDSELLRLTRVVSKSGELTVAGLYALGVYPQGALPALRITAVVRQRDEHGSRILRNLTRFEGPVPVLLEETMTWLRANITKFRTYNQNGDMIDQPVFPLNAVRELVANAIVHRDLGTDTLGAGKSIDIRIEDNKLIVASPGGLRGITVDQLTSSTLSRVAVNQRLYDISTLLHTSDGAAVIEGEGGGIREVLAAVKKQGNPPPVFQDTGVSFTAILWAAPEITTDSNPSVSTEAGAPGFRTGKTENRGSSAVLKTKYGSLMVAMLKEGKTTVAEISTATGMPKYTVRYALNTLMSQGIVIRKGGRGKPLTTYHLKI